MPGQHPNAVKEERSHRAIAIGDAMNLAYRQNMIGSVQPVLFEETSGGLYTGHAPNYIKVYAEGTELHNLVKLVRITEVFRDGVRGEIQEA